MNTLSDLIKYTQSKKRYQLSELEKSHYLRPHEIFNDFINNKLSTKSTVALNMEYISSWYLWKYIHEFIEKDKIDYSLLAQSTCWGYHGNLLNYLIGQIAPQYDSCVLLRTAVMHLAQMMMLGWDELSVRYGKMMIEMLHGKYYKGGQPKPLYVWFIVELFCRWQKISLDKSVLNMPDSLKIYEKALQYLDSCDMDIIQNIINDLAAFHIQNADEYVKTDKYGNESSAEFVSSDYFIFPVEIIMYLSVRKRLKMPENNADNELMALSINRFPGDSIKIPSEKVIHTVFEKIYRENPRLKLYR